MTTKPSRLRGFNQPFPTRALEQLSRSWSMLNRRALAFLRRNRGTLQRVMAGDVSALEPMLRELAEELPTYLPEERVRKQAAGVANRINARQRELFFAAVSQSTGLVLLNTDDPDAKTPNLTLAPTGVLNFTVPGPVARRIRKPRGDAVFSVNIGAPPTPGAAATVKVNVDPRLRVDEFVDASTSRITTLRDGVVEGVRDAVVRESIVGEGNPAELTRRVMEQFEKHGVPSKIPTRRLTQAGEPVAVSAEAHAAFIARDQLGTLNMELARARQTAAGVLAFKWVTKGDSKVRPEHRARNGKVYTWEEGADGEFPGGPPNCRCHAQAVVDPSDVASSDTVVPLAG